MISAKEKSFGIHPYYRREIIFMKKLLCTLLALAMMLSVFAVGYRSGKHYSRL